MRDVCELHKEWLRDPVYRVEYEALEPELALALALIAARATAGLTQEQAARRMEINQSVVARLEGGRTRPSTKTLQRFAEATGTRLRTGFEPALVGAPGE